MLDAVWQSTVIFFIAYFVYANNAQVDALSFAFSLICSMMVTSLIHVLLQTTRIEIALISSIVLSFLVFLVFTLIFDTTCVTCQSGQSPYQVSYTMFRQGVFWFTNLFTIITAMLPRFLVKCIYNSTVNPLLHEDQETTSSNSTPSTTQETYL
jgi:phospholipid-translocating ATPase